MKNEGVSVKKIWAHRIQDALKIVNDIQDMPKVIVLHPSTNNLQEMEAELIVSMIYDIYQIVNRRQAKLIWNNIIPCNDDPCLNAKAALINALVGVRLINEDGVFITRNDNFYSGDTINPRGYDQPCPFHRRWRPYP